MKVIFSFVLILSINLVRGQSVEIMPGTRNFFFDIQFLKPLSQKGYQYTIFSRTRGLLDYEGNANILSSAFLSYTSKHGVGGSLIGAVSSSDGPSIAAGLNFLKVKNEFSIFALAAVEGGDGIGYSFFTIMRYTPKLKENWKFYSSLELFTLFGQDGHEVSSERLRLGLDHKNVQFGIGANLTQFGSDFTFRGNYGIFIRKSFKK